MYGVNVLALGPLPAAFTARIVNVYSTPLVSPFTLTGEVALDAVCPPEEVAMYEVIVPPPLSVGGVKAISTEAGPSLLNDLT
jgi:hypothetical protein